MDDIDLTLPDFLDRKKNPRTEPLPKNISWKLKDPNRIIWPKKEIERAMKRKAREAKAAKKDAAASLKGCTFTNRKGQ
jgi:hypothetical protein